LSAKPCDWSARLCSCEFAASGDGGGAPLVSVFVALAVSLLVAAGDGGGAPLVSVLVALAVSLLVAAGERPGVNCLYLLCTSSNKL
jgi:hypothetical protein